jgi:hypothetical protein
MARSSNHAPPSNVDNEWRYTSAPPYIFMAWYLIKHRESFALEKLRYESTGMILLVQNILVVGFCENGDAPSVSIKI